MNVRHWAILILSKWVSDYNRYDEAYQWWWHVIWTRPAEELKVYNLYYSDQALFRKNADLHNWKQWSQWIAI